MNKTLILVLTIMLLLLSFLFARYWINHPGLSWLVESTCSFPTEEKVLYLTFDDGPDPIITPVLLKVLDQYQIKATFFVNGNKVERSPEVARKIVEAGHLLGNHSYQHENMIFKSFDYIEQDLLKTDSLIRQVGQVPISYYRPPYGRSFVNLPRVLKAHNRTILNWSIAPVAQYEEPFPKEKVLHEILDNLSPGAIILLHDGYTGLDAQSLAEMVEQLILESRAKGYRISSLENRPK